MPSPFSLFFHSSIGKKKEKIAFPIAFRQIVFAISKTIILRCRITTIPVGERGPHKSDWLPGSQDPLEVVMKSVTLASQLYVSIHNPSPKTSP